MTAVEWLGIRNDPQLTVCFGTALGYLSIWRQGSKEVYEEVSTTKIGGGKEILSIEADKPTPNEVRFIVGSLCGHVQLWKYENGSLENIFAITIGTTIPRKVAFTPMAASSKSKARTITVYGLYDGQMYLFFFLSPTVG